MYQIDYILMPQRFKSSINKAGTRTFPGADIGSDHDLVMMSMRIRLKRVSHQEPSRIRFDVDKLKDPEVDAIFQAKIGGKFAVLRLLDQDIDSLTEEFNEVVRTTAEEVLGKRRVKKQPWMPDEVLPLCDVRRTLSKTKHTNQDDKIRYQEINRDIRNKMKKAKNQWFDDRCEKIEEGFMYGNNKMAYKTIKTITKHQHGRQ